ncbi:MAG TPA: hypothetical protein VGK38_01125, partial [Prolixibacteraceae bacterium]
MKSQIEDISNYLGRALFIVLFFLLMAAFSNRSVEKSSDKVKIELAYEWHATAEKAISVDAVELPLFQKNWVSSVDNLSLQFFNATFKQSADNRKIAQRFISLHQIELVLKPFPISRFYYHHFPIVAED